MHVELLYGVARRLMTRKLFETFKIKSFYFNNGKAQIPYWFKRFSTKVLVSEQQTHWSEACKNAEQLLGEEMISNLAQKILEVKPQEFEDVTNQIEKLQGLKHPILDIQNIESFLSYDIARLSIRGQLIMLISMSLGLRNGNITEEEASVIKKKQKMIAEIIDMINTARFVHGHVLDTHHYVGDMKVVKKLELGNKVAVLAGDYFLAFACVALAELDLPKVCELIGSAMTDCMSGEFLWKVDKKNKALLTADDDVNTWKEHVHLSEGSLMISGGLSVIAFDTHNEEIEDNVRKFFHNFVLAWKAYDDLQPFLIPCDKPFPLNSLPLLIHIQKEPIELLENVTDLETMDTSKYQQIHAAVCGGHAVEEVRVMIEEFSNASLNALQQLIDKDNDAADILRSMVTALNK